MKRIIEFALSTKHLMKDDQQEMVRVEFEWDGEEDVMRPAFAALKEQMDKVEGLIEYDINDWYWIQ